ncbi:hypothetical protein [Mangrovivirga cuniculi]|uniref:Uncharacterized protein n=1 Tax=Mangrovivirga cuniculi TaxID=2715131 RepID=A0A4D7JL39_9BACT|nr:hypothetical protein [Mangrovivirga cuniculi]QCK16321.1 hypothetical protein DCC35_17050 [Mangrovivirga cuniculi]
MNKSEIPKSWVYTAFFHLLIVALIGCLLRLMFVSPVTCVTYKYILHAHSHVAFLGWVFSAIMILLLKTWLPGSISKFRSLFWAIQFSVVGMLITFPIKGYFLWSIIFSTLHMVLATIFAIRFYLKTKSKIQKGRTYDLKFIYWGFIFMIISSIGPFALGYLMANNMGGSDWYSLSIYFYLHFQYNGFFTFILIGLLIYFLSSRGIDFSKKKLKLIFYLMVISCFLSFFLSTTWVWKNIYVYAISLISGILQLYAFLLIITELIRNVKPSRTKFGRSSTLLISISLVILMLKGILQLLTAFPYFAELALVYRELVIGYLHLVFLGLITPLLFAYLLIQKSIIANLYFRIGILIYFTAFIFTEILLFGESLYRAYFSNSLPYYFDLIFGASCLFPFAIFIMLISQHSSIIFSYKRQGNKKEKCLGPI